MAEPAASRQERIMAWLRDQQTISIDDLAERLNVSGMTIHRDLNELARLGSVEKIHGGARLAGLALRGLTPTPCAVCGGSTPERTAFIVTHADTPPMSLCCPHCGMLAHNVQNAQSILARDYLYGRMVNARQARFLVGCGVTVCCHPSVLCFASDEDARNFQLGFGGRVMSFDETLATITEEHGHCSSSHN